jgi:hypothetical protein
MKRFSFILFFLVQSAFADYVRPGYEGIRPTGMGNAFIALADDANALFYNPAALARIKGVHVNLLNFTQGVDSTDTLSRFGNAIFDGKYNNLIRQDTEFLRFDFMPTVVVPNFGVSIFNQGQGFFDMRNVTTSGIEVAAHNDVGILAGFAIPFGDYFSIGFSAKGFQRTGVDASMTPDEIIAAAGINIDSFLTNIYDNLKEFAGTGWAVGLNAGALVRIPTLDRNAKFTLAATVDDIGDTSFTKLSDSAPRSVRHSYNLGAAYSKEIGKNLRVNLTTDLRHIFDSIPFMKQFHFGAELRHKIWAIRTGLYQGYPTGGFSIEFPPHTRLHFSTYSVEIGSKLWERQHRWYLLQLVVGFNPF